MNLTNSTNSVNYISIPIPLISSIGFVFNMLCLIILLRPCFKEKYRFRYIIVKVIFDLIVSFIGSGLLDSNCVLFCLISNNYFGIFYQLYIKIIFAGFIYASNSVIEILLIYDRTLILENRTNFLNIKKNFKYILIVSFILNGLIILPLILGYSIENLMNNYYISLTQFGFSSFFQYYQIFYIIITNPLSILITVIMSIKSIKACHDFSARRSYLTSNLNFNFEIKFTMMVLILTLLFILVRVFSLISIILRKISQENNILIMETILFDYITQILLYIHTGSNFFILFLFNRKFRNSFHFKYFCN